MRHHLNHRAMLAAYFAVAVLCCGQFANSQTLTAYYNFEGNFNDYPGAGVFADDLATQQPGAMLVGDASPGKNSTMSYRFDQTTSDSRVWTNAWSPDITSTDQYTIMFWLKGDDDLQQLNNTRLASARYDAANASQPSPNVSWQIEGFGQSGSGNGPDLRIQDNTNATTVGNFFAPPANGALGNDGDPNNDVWHHVAFVISNTGSDANNRAYMETFLDGTSLGQNESTPATGTTQLRNLDGRLILGGHNVAGRSATGYLDDFALFDGIVEDADIAAVAAGDLSPADFLPSANAVPEPASIALWSLLGLALAGYGVYRRRRAK